MAELDLKNHEGMDMLRAHAQFTPAGQRAVRRARGARAPPSCRADRARARIRRPRSISPSSAVGARRAARCGECPDNQPTLTQTRRTQIALAAVLAGLVLAVYAQTYRHGFRRVRRPGLRQRKRRRAPRPHPLRRALGRHHRPAGQLEPAHLALVHARRCSCSAPAPARYLVNGAASRQHAAAGSRSLLRMTRARAGPVSAVAALFGIHPLHVESVA